MSILKKNVHIPGRVYKLIGPDENYYFLPTVRKITGRPYVPSDAEVRKLEEAAPEKLAKKSNSPKLVKWQIALHREVAEVANSGKTPREIGGILGGLSKMYDRACIQSVRFMLYYQWIQSAAPESVRPDPGQKFVFRGVEGIDDETLLVKPGIRTIDEQAIIHGKAMHEFYLQRAFDGEGDFVAVTRDAARGGRRRD